METNKYYTGTTMSPWKLNAKVIEFLLPSDDKMEGLIEFSMEDMKAASTGGVGGIWEIIVIVINKSPADTFFTKSDIWELCKDAKTKRQAS